MDSIRDSVEKIRDRIAESASRAGRDPNEITIVAVSKKQPAAAIEAVIRAGIVNIGENYVQEASEKKARLDSSISATSTWHLLGHLQANKARIAATTFDIFQSVDSVRLAAKLGQIARESGKEFPILLQVHLGNEPTKSGTPTEIALETAAQISEIPGIALQGLMGLAPSNEDARLYFQELRALFEDLPPANRIALSMGMSGDFPIAVEEGATLVRIGSAIFGERSY